MPENIVGKIATAIDGLADNPRPANCKKLKGIGDTYRIRVGDYRVLYTVDDSIVTVEIVKVGNRKDIFILTLESAPIIETPTAAQFQLLQYGRPYPQIERIVTTAEGAPRKRGPVEGHIPAM